MAKWIPAKRDDGSHDTCPRCKRPVEWLMVTACREDDGEEREYLDAERCRPCGWQIDFDD